MDQEQEVREHLDHLKRVIPTIQGNRRKRILVPMLIERAEILEFLFVMGASNGNKESSEVASREEE
jgi:hypothetical protein